MFVYAVCRNVQLRSAHGDLISEKDARQNRRCDIGVKAGDRDREVSSSQTWPLVKSTRMNDDTDRRRNTAGCHNLFNTVTALPAQLVTYRVGQKSKTTFLL